MPETPDQLDDKKAEIQQPTERVGDLLHKERITRRITIETMAKDLKLNVGYIKSIEANNFDDLPADPYIRVYLRSIASYLSLDPEVIIRRYFIDKGQVYRPHTGTAEEKISVQSDTDHQQIPWVPIAAVFVVLVLLAFVANKMGWTAPSGAPAVVTDSLDIVEQLPDDSVAKADSAAIDSAMALSADSTAVKAADSLRISMASTKDSIWSYVFTDGKKWSGRYMRNGTRSFAAIDSINIYVVDNGPIRYTINGVAQTVPGKGVKAFRLTAKGFKEYTASEFKATFKSQL